MIKSKRKANRALIVNNVRLYRDLDGDTVYVDLLTGLAYGFLRGYTSGVCPVDTLRITRTIRNNNPLFPSTHTGPLEHVSG